MQCIWCILFSQPCIILYNILHILNCRPGSTAVIGKAPLADLKSGLATAPTLFAAEEFPQLLPLIARKFESPGDVDEALSIVTRSQGLVRCKRLAQVHAERAIEAIRVLQPSAARESLIALACKIVIRNH